MEDTDILIDDGQQAAAVADSTDEISIEVVDDVPEQEKPRLSGTELADYKPYDSKNDTGLKNVSPDIQKRIDRLTFEREEFKRQHAQSTRERDELLRYSQTLTQRDGELRKFATGQSASALQAAKARVADGLTHASAELKQAVDMADSEKQVAANQRLALFAAEQSRLSAIPDPNENSFIPPPPPPNIQPRQEAQVSERGMRWAQANPWFKANNVNGQLAPLNDESAHAFRVHERLLRSGVQIDSEPYYEALDAEMSKRFPETAGQQRSAPVSAPPKKPASVVAPVVRQGPGGQRTVRLTPTQIKMADSLGLDRKMYALQVLKDTQDANA